MDWWEWGEAAFAAAAHRDVPVLLSVGYAACHWCHVMAHESFEDEETAQLMNSLFVNIKVDREERPDVDSIYMEAVQAMNGHGGWPMTVWLDHGGRPFYAGTYFPKQAHRGMPSFREVMRAVSDAWHQRRQEVDDQAGRLVAAIDRTIPVGDLPDSETLQRAYNQVEATFDPVNGGFGTAPKFPQQPVLDYLISVTGRSWAPNAGAMLDRTLTKMALGGIHDLVGGGFARYSVDASWTVPHFEKMLYDNAQLARLYLWASVELDRPEFAAVARSTYSYLMTDLRHPDGAFYSSEDADSEGVEGRFYVWNDEELEGLVTDPESRDYLGLGAPPNFEGQRILTARSLEPPRGWDKTRKVLAKRRSQRVRPAVDDKIITAWNGLAIKAFAEAGAVWQDAELIAAAESCAEFIRDNLFVVGALHRSWRDGATSGPGFLDDHASLAVGLFTLFSATGRQEWFELALELVRRLDRFSAEDGGFYSTAESNLVKRPRDFTDNPSPSASGLAIEALHIAALFTGDSGLAQRADFALAAVGRVIDTHPSMVGHHLRLASTRGSAVEVAIVGKDWPRLASEYWNAYRPASVLAVTDGQPGAVPLLAGRSPNGSTMAWVCRNFVCELPVSTASDLAEQLASDDP